MRNQEIAGEEKTVEDIGLEYLVYIRRVKS
jgi:hypothetical protein